MRAALTTLVFVALAYAAHAQFSLTPKAGIESSRTTINYNDLHCLSPLGAVISPQIGLRLDYKFKKQHGPYVGLGTNRSAVAFQFDNPEQGMTNYTADPGKLGLRLEGGYTYSFKPIHFNKSSAAAAKSSASKTTAPKQTQATPSRSGCRKYSSSNGCGSKEKSASKSSCGDKSSKATPAVAKNPKNLGWNMRIQPSAGVAFNTSTPDNIVTGKNGTTYQYNAGNWKTAFIAGTDFEFGKGRTRMFTVGVQYIQGLDNMGTETITSSTGTKSTTTYLNSKSSAWNLTVGIPFSLSKSKSAHKAKQATKVKEVKKQCIYYRPCRGA